MSNGEWNSPLLSVRTPEWVLGLYAFLLHFLWEMLQTPFFADMTGMPHWPATLLCLRATVGDVAIALAAFAAAAAMQKSRGWFVAPARNALLAYVLVGVVATVALEIHATTQGRWSYSGLMPVIPGLGVGMVPLAQWLILPWPLLFLLRRHHLGARHPY
jgi:hypothetical protein